MHPTESTRCRPTSEQEATDMYGYLKPTFHQYSTSSDNISPTTTTAEASNYSEPIPVESYASAPSSSGACAASLSSDLPVTDSSSENSTSATEPCYDTPTPAGGSATPSSSLNRNEIRPLIPSFEAVQV